MKSGKQRRTELAAKKQARTTKKEIREKPVQIAGDAAPVNYELLAPNNSYSGSDFMRCGFYVDKPFRCIDCGADEIWTARQQKWWFEVAKGHIFSTARRCRTCRRKERDRSNESRRVHMEGLARREKEKRSRYE